MRVAVYVSDMGYGHATRQIAVVRALLKMHSEAKVFVRTHTTKELFRKTFHNDRRVAVGDVRNDPGAVSLPGSMAIDERKTYAAVKEWIDGWEPYIKTEANFCKEEKIDVVASDITPQAFLAAEKLGIPSIGITNFTWDWIYANIFGDTAEVERITEAYRAAELGLRLPMSFDAFPFKKTKSVGLIVRKSTRGRDDMRKLSGVSDEKMAFVNFGYSTNISGITPPKGMKLLMSSRDAIPGAIQIPEDDYESEDWIGACDLLVSKASYGVSSEAIQGKVPMMLSLRPGMIESDVILAELSKLGIALEVTQEEITSGAWEAKAQKALECRRFYEKLPAVYTRDGAAEAAEIISQMA